MCEVAVACVSKSGPATHLCLEYTFGQPQNRFWLEDVSAAVNYERLDTLSKLKFAGITSWRPYPGGLVRDLSAEES